MVQNFSALRKYLPAAVFVIGVAASVTTRLQIGADITRDALIAAGVEADTVTSLISDHLQTLGLVLRGGAGAFADPADPQPGEWKVFSQQLQPQLTLPGVQGVGFAQAIRPEQLDAHVARVRGWGFPDYTITPPDRRDFYTSVIFLEPFADRNLRAFGYDMYSEPVRRAAMEQARDSGLPSLSAKVALVQENDANPQAGVLLYFPLYQQGPGRVVETDRRSALLGWTYSPLRMGDFISGILREAQQHWSHQAGLYIYDGDNMDSDALLFNSAPAANAFATMGQPAHLHRSIIFNGHAWTLAFDFTPVLAQTSYAAAWFGFGSGLVISALVFFLLRLLMTVQERSRALARELTAELLEKQQHLADSEFRWKFALEGAGDGVWDWDVANDNVFYSRLCLEMLGYSEGEIGTSIDEWKSRIDPRDSDRCMTMIQACLDGTARSFALEHRLRDKDGSFKWVLSRGMSIAQDRDGKALRLLGTLKDISAHKRTEAELLDAQRIAKVGSWTLDVASNKVVWSGELFRMLGLDAVAGAPDYDAQAHLFTPESWQRLSTAVASAMEAGDPYELELEAIRPDGNHLFMLAHGEAERGPDGNIVRLRGTAADITSRVISRRQIEKLALLYAALSACNSAIVHCLTAEELLQRVCEVVVNHGKMTLAWIGLIDTDTGKIIPRYWSGEGAHYLDGIDISIRADLPQGQGPSGTSVRENRPVWVDDFRTSPRTIQWHKRAASYGWASSAAIPLCRGGKPVGTLTFYSTEANWFSPEIRSLLEEMGRNIGYALDKLEAEAEARTYQTTLVEAEQRFRSLVEQSIVGIFIVQKQRFVYCNPQLESLLGYPHDGSLYEVAPGHIISERDRPRVQELIENIFAGKLRTFEHMCSAVRRDGSTLDIGISISGSTYQQQPALIGVIQDTANRKVAEAQIQRYARNLEKVFTQTVGMVTNLVEMRDPYTVGHEKHVADLAVAIGREMQISPHQLEGLQIGGYLHDVGKVSVPSEILSKPGRITAIEYELIKGHPTAGYQILKEVDFPWPVAEIAYQHHERMDGSGYPRGLKGNEILLEARIVAVADVVESMNSHRPYRPGLGIDKALAEIEQGRGSRYDAAVVDACVRLLREKGFLLPQ